MYLCSRVKNLGIIQWFAVFFGSYVVTFIKYRLESGWNEKGDNLDQPGKVLASAGFNWQTFLNLLTLNITNIILLTVKLLKQKF